MTLLLLRDQEAIALSFERDYALLLKQFYQRNADPTSHSALRLQAGNLLHELSVINQPVCFEERIRQFLDQLAQALKQFVESYLSVPVHHTDRERLHAAQ